MSDSETPEEENEPDLEENEADLEENEADLAVQVVEEVTMDGGEVNFGESDGEVSGDVLSGGAVRGEGNLTVCFKL